MNVEAYRELKVLDELAADSQLTQRRLARRLRVALGLANVMIRRCVKKGYVKVVNVRKNRLRYLLTPKGIAEKTRLTYQYLDYSLYLYRTVRRLLRQSLAQVASSGGRQVVIIGAGELAEMAYLAVKEAELNLIAVVDDHTDRRHLLGVPVVRSPELAQLAFDCGIVSALDDGVGLRRLQALGVPARKLIVLDRQGPRIRALNAPANVLSL